VPQRCDLSFPTNWYNKSCFEIFKHMMLSMPAINNKTVSFRYAGAKASLDLNDNVLFGRSSGGRPWCALIVILRVIRPPVLKVQQDQQATPRPFIDFRSVA